MSIIKTKFRAGKYLIPVTLTHAGNRIQIQFPFNKTLIAEMKSFDDSKWNPDGKFWHIPDTQRNRFQLEYLQGQNPYAPYELNLLPVKARRSLYSHQLEMLAFGLTRHYCVFAAEMGCLHGNTRINGLEMWYRYIRNLLPTVGAYDSKGNIIITQASRILRKRQKIVRIQVGNLDLRVGSQHLFLALKDGNPSHVRAINLTQEHSLITDKSCGTTITSIQSTQNMPIDFEKPTKFILAKESEHVIPSSFQHLGELSLKNASITMEPQQWVYDLTIPEYGNYFDDNGINHQNTGKTLVAIELMEAIPDLKSEEAWYVGPKSGVRAVELELLKWQSLVHPKMMTYEQLTKIMKNWVDGQKAPRVVIFDESSKLKTPTAQRSQAAVALANGVRSDWGNQGYVILMSGTPAPKAPTDWWNQCEVACPGFIKEGNIHKFRSRLAIIEERENTITGGKYPHLVGWRDSEDRCECGLMRDDDVHDVIHHLGDDGYHTFKAGKNEVAYLYERMKGLAIVKLKKDCLDLPEKQYRIITIKPAAELLMVARHIKQTGARAIEVLTLLRELSDGFQYTEIETGNKIKCPRCDGTGKVMLPVPKEEIKFDQPTREINESMFEMKEMTCDHCSGLCEVQTYTRGMTEVPCPKDDQLRLDLEDHEECGRLIVWGGFTGTIDRITKLCLAEGWAVLRVDGRGYCAMISEGQLDDKECLMAMDASHPRRQEFAEKYPKLCFVGHPKAGGMALTLTASPTEIFYSNDFSGEGRMQAEDRGHRPGMDLNKGLTIVDYIHLPSDQYVLDNLKKKKELQALSLGELDAMFKGEAND